MIHILSDYNLNLTATRFFLGNNNLLQHKNYKYIDRSQKSFCHQLLVEVMSSALCCILEKIRSEGYIDQILGDEEMESGSIGEVVRYFSDTLEWDFSTPDKLSLSTRKFFDGRMHE